MRRPACAQPTAAPCRPPCTKMKRPCSSSAAAKPSAIVRPAMPCSCCASCWPSSRRPVPRTRWRSAACWTSRAHPRGAPHEAPQFIHLGGGPARHPVRPAAAGGAAQPRHVGARADRHHPEARRSDRAGPGRIGRAPGRCRPPGPAPRPRRPLVRRQRQHQPPAAAAARRRRPAQRRHQPAAGQDFQLGGARFVVEAAGAEALVFSGPGGRWRFDGATVLRNGEAQPACPDTPLPVRLLARWNRLAPKTLTLPRALSFGGNLYCGNRIGIAGIEPQSASLARVDGALQLAGSPSAMLMLGEAPGPRQVSDRGAPAGAAVLARQEHALNGVTALVAGHTRFAASIEGSTLLLRPAGHVALYPQAVQGLPPQLQWRWRDRSLWNLPGGPAWSVTATLAALLIAWLAWRWQRGRWPFTRDGDVGGAIASSLLALAGLHFLLLQRAGTPPGAGLSMLLGWAALWCVLLCAGRLRLAGAAAVLLLAVGLLAQLELGLGALESSWLRHFQKSTALLAIGIG